MKQFTLDSNVAINASIKQGKCLDILKLFLREFSQDICFLTPQVKRELSNIQPKISYLLIILKNHYMLKGISIREGYKTFLQGFEDKKDKKEFEKFSNIIEYLDINNVDENNIEDFSRAIVGEITRITARDIPIKPTEEERRLNSKSINDNSTFLMNSNLVKDVDDSKIISELMHHTTSFIQEVCFTTDNLKDFASNSDAWKANANLKLIEVLSSDDFYKKYATTNSELN